METENNCELQIANSSLRSEASPLGSSPPPEAHYLVYKLTSPENKVYIGYTGKTLKKRMRNGYHMWEENNASPMAQAFRKYGKDGFRKEILCDHLTLEGAWKLEDWFIQYYDSMNPEKGYNRATGGSSLGRNLSGPCKEEISRSLRRSYETDPELSRRSQKSRQKVYEARPELRAKTSSFMKKRAEEGKLNALLLSDHKPRPVICVETGTFYSSQSEAERLTGFRDVHKVCHGHYQTCGGKHWRFATVEEIKKAAQFSEPQRDVG
ncbi:MAG: hypothetical protein IJ237_06570 [Oscillospiraceae bacterium]|nr:hypothetical protein [Oscillospiraceae bacterium]